MLLTNAIWRFASPVTLVKNFLLLEYLRTDTSYELVSKRVSLCRNIHPIKTWISVYRPAEHDRGDWVQPSAHRAVWNFIPDLFRQENRRGLNAWKSSLFFQVQVIDVLRISNPSLLFQYWASILAFKFYTLDWMKKFALDTKRNLQTSLRFWVRLMF